MIDGGSKGIIGEVYSSNFGVVGQGIDDRLDRGGCCLSSRRHNEDGFNGLFRFLGLEGMVQGEGRTMREGTNRWVGVQNADGVTALDNCARTVMWRGHCRRWFSMTTVSVIEADWTATRERENGKLFIFDSDSASAGFAPTGA